MLENTRVATSFVNGTTINMDAMSTQNFFTNLAISTIALCREEVYYKNGHILDSTVELPYYDELIDKYCSGVHGAIIENILNQNIQIIYRFIQDCVLNETNRGLYLMQQISKVGVPFWKILILAINEYKEIIKRRLALVNEEINSEKFIYDRYNEQFEELMNRG